MTVDRQTLIRAAVDALGGGQLNDRQRDQVDDAVALVERALRAWAIRDPLGWVSEVVWLDTPRANAALQRLIQEHATAPSYAAFLAMYRSLDTRLPVSVTGPTCRRCAGSGAIDCTDDRRHARSCRQRGTVYGGDGDCFCRAVVPCPDCAEGDRMTPVMRRIREANDNELRRALGDDEP